MNIPTSHLSPRALWDALVRSRRPLTERGESHLNSNNLDANAHGDPVPTLRSPGAEASPYTRRDGLFYERKH